MSGEPAEYWARRYLAQPWGGKAAVPYRTLLGEIRRELNTPMERCPSCEEPGYPTLLSWPERSQHPKDRKQAKYGRRRYGLCVLCGYKFVIWEFRAKRPGQPNCFSEEEGDRILEMYLEEGWDCPSLAKMYFCHPGTIRNVLKSRGIKLKHGGSKPGKNTTHQELETVRFLRVNLGWTQGQIAEYMGVKESYIQTRCKIGGFYRYGVVPKKRPKRRKKRAKPRPQPQQTT